VYYTKGIENYLLLRGSLSGETILFSLLMFHMKRLR